MVLLIFFLFLFEFLFFWFPLLSFYFLPSADFIFFVHLFIIHLGARLSCQFEIFSSFLRKAYIAMNFLLSTAFAASHKFWGVISSLSFVLRYFLISFGTIGFLVACCLVSMRMAIINKSTNKKCWRGCWEKGTILHSWWECKLVQLLWRTVQR